MENKVLIPNSLEALEWGLTNFDGIEFDVRLSKDDVPVIHHDAHLASGQLIRETERI